MPIFAITKYNKTTKTDIMKVANHTSSEYAQIANEALKDIEALKVKMLAYMGSRPLKKIQKEVDFILMCDEMKKLKEFRVDMITLSINTAKLEMIQKTLN